jgi:GNAT superfamily N-acetyltransferase
MAGGESRGGGTQLTVHPLTPELWSAFEDLFADGGPCSRCWCMYWRIGPAYRAQASDVNRAAFREIVERGPPPGLLAFDGDVAVGWCQLTPRDEVPHLDRVRRLARVDEVPVWSLSCFYIRKDHRRRGITAVLIAAALTAAKQACAPAIEAYPLDRSLTPSTTSTGVASTFERAGFRTIVRRVPPRPIMRYELVGIRSPSRR